MIDLIDLSGIDVPVAVGENIPEATDIDEFLPVRCGKHVTVDERNEYVCICYVIEIAPFETTDQPADVYARLGGFLETSFDDILELGITLEALLWDTLLVAKSIEAFLELREHFTEPSPLVNHARGAGDDARSCAPRSRCDAERVRLAFDERLRADSEAASPPRPCQRATARFRALRLRPGDRRL